MIQKLLVGLLLIFLLTPNCYASAEHKEGEVHGKEDGHVHDEHEEDGEQAASVGPEKGITEVSERDGFKLSEQALKNFDLSFIKLNGNGPWNLPKTAVVHSGEEVNVFRRRSGFFKRIDFQILKRQDRTFLIDSDDLREGDEVVTQGLGFLRIAELAATGDVAHGHSH